MISNNKKTLAFYGLASGVALISLIYQQLILSGGVNDWNLFLARYRVNNIHQMVFPMLILGGSLFIDRNGELFNYVKFIIWMFFTIGGAHLILNLIGISYDELVYLIIGLLFLWILGFILIVYKKTP